MIFAFQFERHLFALFVCAIFSVRFTQIYCHVTKELCAWLITRYTFLAHCCVIYQRTITQDADLFWEDENVIKFPSKIDFNICENQKMNEPFVAFLSILILICWTSRITLCGKSCDLERKYVFFATPVSQKRRRQPISFILDSLSALMNVSDSKFSRNTMKLLNHNASTLKTTLNTPKTKNKNKNKNTTQHNTTQHNTTQHNKTKQNKTKQNKTKQNTTKQNKTKQNSDNGHWRTHKNNKFDSCVLR